MNHMFFSDSNIPCNASDASSYHGCVKPTVGRSLKFSMDFPHGFHPLGNHPFPRGVFIASFFSQIVPTNPHIREHLPKGRVFTTNDRIFYLLWVNQSSPFLEVVWLPLSWVVYAIVFTTLIIMSPCICNLPLIIH